jgi:hypothetical protein
MSQVARATLAVDKAGESYCVHAYDYDPKADRVGVQAAESLGVAPSIVLKSKNSGDRQPDGVVGMTEPATPAYDNRF